MGAAIAFGERCNLRISERAAKSIRFVKLTRKPRPERQTDAFCDVSHSISKRSDLYNRTSRTRLLFKIIPGGILITLCAAGLAKRDLLACFASQNMRIWHRKRGISPQLHKTRRFGHRSTAPRSFCEYPTIRDNAYRSPDKPCRPQHLRQSCRTSHRGAQPDP